MIINWCRDKFSSLIQTHGISSFIDDKPTQVDFRIIENTNIDKAIINPIINKSFENSP